MQKLVRTALAVATLAAAVANVTHAAEGSKWYDNMKIKGDIRYRYQYDERDALISGNATSSDQSRHRIRMRLGTYGAINDAMDYGVSLATGGDGSANSTNQSLGPTTTASGGTGSSFGKYSIGVDKAYVNMKFIPDTKLTVGKMDNPFWAPQSSPLVWDGDINPEGLAFNYATGGFWATISHLLPDSDTEGINESTKAMSTSSSQQLSALQLGFKTGGFTAGATYYHASSDPVPTAKGTLLTGADMFDLGLEYAFMISEMKSAVYGHYLANTDDATVNDQDSSWLVGYNIGGKQWKAGVAYLDMGDDAVSGLQDSDFNGGLSDSEGFKVNVSYNIAKNADAGLTYFDWESKTGVGAARKSWDGSTLQADLAFKF